MERINPDHALRPVFVLAEHCASGPGQWHAHRRAQLIHASNGVLTVRTASGLWVVPPHRAVWVLPGTRHQVSARNDFALCTLYAEAKAVCLPPACCVVAVDNLVRELLLAAAGYGPDYPADGMEARLIQVILDRLPTLLTAPLHLPQPGNQRLLRIANMLDADPADNRSLAQLADMIGMSERTAARLFQKETGLSFGKWRQQLRMLKALEILGTGASVIQAALEVGYSDVSSFIAVFKSAFGATPAKYFD